jgi:hypothetical protein
MIENIIMHWSSLMLHGKLHGDDKVLWMFLKKQLVTALNAPDLALVVRDATEDDVVYFYTVEQLKALDEDEMEFIIESSAKYKAKLDGLQC